MWSATKLTSISERWTSVQTTIFIKIVGWTIDSKYNYLIYVVF